MDLEMHEYGNTIVDGEDNRAQNIDSHNGLFACGKKKDMDLHTTDRLSNYEDRDGRLNNDNLDVDCIRIIEQPKVGMKFDSIKEAEDIYYAYAGRKGFCM
ncbi:hypothetical protein ZOSMA_71G00540 [Zostera marina]|uniref:Uncharacterized protein n=1 Tax=Zostera marina TaxID=29655 RepID=A0A0K9NQB3_ZOSMR|nr:hypothetical protein ZOSMA_71G00540 [Zostera marina]